jgi:hypothetical protein
MTDGPSCCTKNRLQCAILQRENKSQYDVDHLFRKSEVDTIEKSIKKGNKRNCSNSLNVTVTIFIFFILRNGINREKTTY